MASALQRVVNRAWEIKNLVVQRGSVAPITRALGFTGRANAGVYIDHDTALTYGAVWACVQVIAQDIGVLSWQLFQPKEGGGKEQVTGEPLVGVLKDRPNPEMTAQTFRETLCGHVMLMGNGYAEIERNRAGNPIGLWPLLPDRTKPLRLPTGELIYVSWQSATHQWIPIPARDVFHVKGLGFNGLIGYDVVSYMAGTIGQGLAAERYSGAFFANGTHMSGGLFHKKKLSEEARDHLRAEFEKVYRGPDNAFKMAVFEEGMEWKQFSITPEAAQVIETRKHSRTDVAGWFRINPNKIGDWEKATYNNMEQAAIDHVQYTLLSWAVRFEQEANAKLLTAAQREAGMYTRLNIDSLRRGDMETRYEAYKIGREWGWLTANQVLEMEDQDPAGPEGDVLMVPLNYQPAARMLKEPPEIERPRIAAGLRPVARAAVASIHNRELHRIDELKVDSQAMFGRELAAIMEAQRTYATSQLRPIVMTAISLMAPQTETGSEAVVALFDRIIEATVNAYVVRQTEAWRTIYLDADEQVWKSEYFDREPEAQAAIIERQVDQTTEDLFEHIIFLGVLSDAITT